MSLSQRTIETLKSVLEILCAEGEGSEDCSESRTTLTLQPMHFNNLAVNLKMPTWFNSPRLVEITMHLPNAFCRSRENIKTKSTLIRKLCMWIAMDRVQPFRKSPTLLLA
jgi:hypothetical protein